MEEIKQPTKQPFLKKVVNKIRPIRNQISLFFSLILFKLYAFAGDDVKSDFESGKGTASDITSAFDKVTDQAWLVVAGIASLGIAIFASLFMIRTLSLASKKDGRGRGEALSNLGWIIVSIILFAAVGLVIGIVYSMGKGVFSN